MSSTFLRLKSANGADELNPVFLLGNESNVVGRGTESDLQIKAPFISRNHANIFQKNNNWYIQDNNSKNGTFINGKKTVKEPHLLKNGDVISFSMDVEYIFYDIPEEGEETRSAVLPAVKQSIELIQESEDVIIDGIKIEPRLSPQEWQFINILMEDPNRFHTYHDLIRDIYCNGKEDFATSMYVKQLQFIKNDIMKKLTKNGITRKIIENRNGVGYKIING